MPDLRLVGVHDDGENLLLADDEGQRYLLAVDDGLRAAVRRDRAHLSKLQVENQGGLRPRDVQSRIRAGATSEEVAVAAGWSVEKVQRYEGPVLAERAHVAELARRVRLRRRGGEPVLLGTEVAARLENRGVASGSVAWDSWRTEDGPWTVVVSFAAGGRERQARWHIDLASSSVTPVDDEARWLSEESAPAEGPVPGLRLTSVPSAGVYDIEADGGVTSTGSRDAGSLDLVTAMRSRRREPGRGMPARTATARSLPSSADDPAGVPGSRHPVHGARRRPQAEPLELDPTLMDDPPAAHPPASAHQDLAVAEAAVAGGPLEDALLEDALLDDGALDLAALDGAALDGAALDGAALEETAQDEGPVDDADHAVDVPLPLDENPSTSRAAVDEWGGDVPLPLGADGPAEEPPASAEAPHSHTVVVESVTVVDDVAVLDSGAVDQVSVVEQVSVVQTTAVVEATAVVDVPVDGPVDAPQDAADAGSEDPAPAAPRTPPRGGKQRPAGRSRNRRSSVPSWDDIMFGAKRD